MAKIKASIADAMSRAPIRNHEINRHSRLVAMEEQREIDGQSEVASCLGTI